MENSRRPAFYFQERMGRLNWREINRVDLNNLVNNVELKTIEVSISLYIFLP